MTRTTHENGPDESGRCIGFGPREDKCPNEIKGRAVYCPECLGVRAEAVVSKFEQIGQRFRAALARL